MKSAAVLFARLMLRPMRREPVRTALTVFAIALGVAVVVAIDLAAQSAAGSFHSSLESLSGKSDLVITGTGGLDERLLGKLAQLPYAFEFTPRIENFASVNGKGEALPFIGLDLIAHGGDQSFEEHPPREVARLAVGNPIWVGAHLGFHSGQHVRLLINDQLTDFTVEGVLKHRAGEIGDEDAIVTDIGVAQGVTGKIGKLDSIDVIVPPRGDFRRWRDLLARELPASVSIEPEGSRTKENRKMMAAFRWNLHILSYIALVVGAFLIYNTISISVVRRRAEIGIARALGAMRTAIAAAFLAEALLLAIAGSALGLLLGRLMAIGAVQLIGATVESLYATSEPAPIHLSAAVVLTGIALGVVTSLLAALAPAFEAAHVSPVEAMARGRHEYIAAVRSRKTIFGAVLLIFAGVWFARMPPMYGHPAFAYVGSFLLIAGTAVAIPNIIASFAVTANRAIEKFLGIEALLAMRSLRSSIARTSILTAALATAVAMTASVGIMIGSFRETVSVWINDELTADFYLRPAGPPSADRHPTMSAGIADAIERLPGVAAVDRFRAYPITYEGLPATLAGGDTHVAQDSDTTRFLPGEDRRAILSKLPAGDYAVVSEPFANKHNVHPGSLIRLPLAGRELIFEILGVYYDYSTERGFVVLDRRTLLKYLTDPALSNIAVFLKPGGDPAAVRADIDRVISGRAIMVSTNRDLRQGAIAVFDRTFRITYALEAVAVIVAVMGIAGALLALIIDRRREFAVLRFLGAAQPQVRRIILCEAGLLGLLANGVGLILGFALSLILIFVINKQSFGWTIQFHLPVALLLAALTVVYLATLFAGLYPARVATALNPIEVIHEE